MKLSASHNRNIGNDAASREFHAGIVVHVDDDIEGFYPNWDSDLIAPLLTDPTICFVSARLTDRRGGAAFLMEPNADMETDAVEVTFTPTACCAFRPQGCRFDERFLGSGFEDVDLIMKLKQRGPGTRVVINNRCKLIHRNEMKEQSKYYLHNADLFRSIWGFLP
jgi:hypothetical protein